MVEVTLHRCPVGTLAIGSHDGRICLCDWECNPRREANLRKVGSRFGCVLEVGGSEVVLEAMAQLDEYFAGARKAFSVPISLVGTDFQLSVWDGLRSMGYGETVSYAGFARRLGRPGSVRAVATAIAMNPVSILIPCHRVIGGDGSLRGYAGGLSAKQSLLALER